MRLSLKISVATVLGIFVVLLGDGYIRAQRASESLRRDALRDHQVLGRALALAAGAAAERISPERAVELVDDVNLLESGIDIRWVPDRRAPRTRAPVSTEMVQARDPNSHYLLTRVPVSLGLPGYIELRESMAQNDQMVRASFTRAAAATLLVTAWCTSVIFLFGWWFLGRPLRLVAARTRQIGQGDLEQPLLEIRQHDEIGHLAREIDRMCARLREANTVAARETLARITALEQLRHADRLTTVGKLASGVAHELGTPLNVVAARARMIASGESTGPAVSSDATTIVAQAERMAAIVRQLLAFARRRRPDKRSTDLTATIREALELLAPLGARNLVHLEGIGLAEPVHALVDPGQMQQVMINLVVNGIQAQPEGGEVRAILISEPVVHQRAPKVTICVEDDGVGMSEDVRERMFEPFYTTKQVGEGTGLGLAVVHGIIEEHRGTITVETEPGKGTRIRIELPLGDES